MTQMIHLREFLPLIRPHAPTVADPAALASLRAAAARFCRQTKLWREVIEVTLVDGPVRLAPRNTSVVQIEKATKNGHDLTPIPFADLPLDRYDDTTPRGPAKNVFQIRENEVSVYPFEAGDMRVSTFLAPATGPRFGLKDIDGTTNAGLDPIFVAYAAPTLMQDAQNTVPLFLFDDHAISIANGALATIFMFPDEAYTDPSRATYFSGLFAADIRDLASAHYKGQQNAPARVKPHFF